MQDVSVSADQQISITDDEASQLNQLFKGDVNSPDYFYCIANAMGKAWIISGKEQNWSETQRKLQLHFNNWKNCTDAGKPDDVDLYVF